MINIPSSNCPTSSTTNFCLFPEPIFSLTGISDSYDNSLTMVKCRLDDLPDQLKHQTSIYSVIPHIWGCKRVKSLEVELEFTLVVNGLGSSSMTLLK